MPIRDSELNNDNLTIGEYIHSEYDGHDKYMSDQAYSDMIDSIVFACVDILAVVGDKILLINRLQEPQIGPWLVGGRIRTGEQLQQAAHRLMRNETGLTVSEYRFNYLCTYVAAWKKRHQVPVGNGIHTVSLVFKAEFTEAEIDNVRLNEEHDKYELIDIKAILKNSNLYHPALIQCIKALY